MESTNTDVDVALSPSCGSDEMSALQTECAEKEFITMPPEEKLQHFKNQAQVHEDNQEVGTG